MSVRKMVSARQIFCISLALAVIASGALCTCPLMAERMLGALSPASQTSACCGAPSEPDSSQCPSTPGEDCSHCDVAPMVAQRSDAAAGPLAWLGHSAVWREACSNLIVPVKQGATVSRRSQTLFDLRVLLLN
jgi:hypothetical protein